MAAHRYWRIYITGSEHTTHLDISEIQMRLTSSGTDQCSGGTAIYSNQQVTFEASKAFDDSTTTTWYINKGTYPLPQYIGYDFGSGNEKDITELALTSYTGGECVVDFDFQYSDDGSTWTTLFSYSGSTGWGATETRVFDSSGRIYAPFFLDFVGGNDANDGMSFANRWKTFESGATAARITAGSTIRVMASPDETLVGNATWTKDSTTVTLASAVNQTIDNCDTAWTAAANVTATASTSILKQGTAGASIAVAAAFTTGKAAHRQLPSALDLSSYEQVSLWFRCSAAAAVGSLELRLCSDTSGNTAVHTIPLTEASPVADRWMAVVKDFAAALSTSIQSVALYVNSDLGASTVTVYLDNIIACKDSALDDALTHNSLIGKVHNKSWTASTAYSLNDKRRPSQPNRNGFQYKVTTAGTSGATEPTWPFGFGETVTDGTVVWECVDLEDTWHAIGSIDGTTVKLDGSVNSFSNIRGYHGETETVATYKREPILTQTIQSTFSTVSSVSEGGTVSLPVTISGGWDRTDMSEQSGETWFSGRCGTGYALRSSQSYVNVENINGVRCTIGLLLLSGTVKNCHGVSNTASGIDVSSGVKVRLENACGFMNGQHGVRVVDTHQATGYCIQGSSNGSENAGIGGVQLARFNTRFNYVKARNNRSYGIGGGSATSVSDAIVYNAQTDSNVTSAVNSSGTYGIVRLVNSVVGESTIALESDLGSTTLHTDIGVYSHNHGNVNGSHLITLNGGTIRTVTDQRHTASGYAWRFNPTTTFRSYNYPLRLSVAKIVCTAGTPVNVSIWARKDNANIHGYLSMQGGQIDGVLGDLTADATPSALNTWEQSDSITFTPAENGVVEIEFHVYDGTGTTNNFWIDDLVVT